MGAPRMQPHVSRVVFFVLVLAMQVGLGVYVTARALAPRRLAGEDARRRARGHMRGDPFKEERYG